MDQYYIDAVVGGRSLCFYGCFLMFGLAAQCFIARCLHPGFQVALFVIPVICVFYYLSAGRVPSTVISVSVFLFMSVGQLAYLKKHAGSNFITFSAHVTESRSSVLFWRLCDMLCTSGFVFDVMFLHNGEKQTQIKDDAYVLFSSPGGGTGDEVCILLYCVLWPITPNFELYPDNGQYKRACQKSRLKVVHCKSYCLNTHTHTHTLEWLAYLDH